MILRPGEIAGDVIPYVRLTKDQCSKIDVNVDH